MMRNVLVICYEYRMYTEITPMDTSGAPRLPIGQSVDRRSTVATYGSDAY